MADLVMRKRGALHAGEFGLFIDSPVFEEDFASIKANADVTVTAVQSRNIKQMRLAWALAAKIADTGVLGDADRRDVMNYLLKKAKHVRYIANQHRDGVEVEIVVKSIRFASMDQTAFDRLFNRMIYIVLSEILPDVPEGTLRDEIEKMSGVDTPEPTPTKPVRQRSNRKPPLEPVSVIPPADDHDPVTGEVIDEPPPHDKHENPPPADTFPGDTPIPPAGATTAPPAQRKEPAPQKPTEALPAASAAVVTPQAPPKNAEQWALYARAWIVEMETDPTTTDQSLMIRWNNERALRNDCGVTSEDRQPVFVEYGLAIERMRGRGR